MSTLLPEPVRPSSELPEFDGSVLAASGIQLPVRREADGPDGTVMTFICLCSRILAYQ